MHHHNNTWAIFGAMGSFFSGFVGALANVDAGTWLSLLGIAGSIAVPLLVEWVRVLGDRERKALKDERDHLRRILQDRKPG